MKATVNGCVVAESADIVDCAGYRYFPSGDVRLEWLEKVSKTDHDRACPNGVQFYDVVIDGARYARAAWVYETPQQSHRTTAGRVGFWQDVEVVESDADSVAVPVIRA